MLLFRSKRAVCPYCYRRIESGRAAFRCNGHAAAGKSRCVAKPDPERKKVLGVDEAVLPTWLDERGLLQRHQPFVCLDCLGPTTRVCRPGHRLLHRIVLSSAWSACVGQVRRSCSRFLLRS